MGPASGRRLDPQPLYDRLDLLELAQSLTTLKRQGAYFRGPCPICAPSPKSTAFMVDLGRGGKRPHFKCHRCTASGAALNLWRFKHEGRVEIAPEEYPHVLRAAATAYGITLPETGSAITDEEAKRRAWRERCEEARAVIREHLARCWHEAPAAAPWRETLAGLTGFAPGHTYGWWDETLRPRLEALGVDARTREAIGFGDAAIASVPTGLALAHETPRGRLAGVSVLAHGAWHQLRPRGEPLPPIRLSAPPQGPPRTRRVVLASDLGAAVALLAAFSPSEDDDGSPRAASSLAIAFAPPGDVGDARGLHPLTGRAVLLWPSADELATPRTLVARAGALVSHGLAARIVTAPINLFSARLAREALCSAVTAQLDAAPEFVRWQWEVLTSHGVTPASAGAARWLERTVLPLAARIDGAPDLASLMIFRACAYAQLPVPVTVRAAVDTAPVARTVPSSATSPPRTSSASVPATAVSA